jgi:hypothetical protein
MTHKSKVVCYNQRTKSIRQFESPVVDIARKSFRDSPRLSIAMLRRRLSVTRTQRKQKNSYKSSMDDCFISIYT